MPFDFTYIRKRLEREKYNAVIVADIGTFPHCVAKTKEGKAAKKNYDKWINDSGTPHFQPLLLPPVEASGFINAAKKINKQKPRVSECSNFAYHAVGVLVDDSKIRAQYNIAVIGTMGGRHNIAVLVPLDHEIPKPINPDYQLPPGSLIVDPWAVGMGHSSKHALGVPPEEFAYRHTLYMGFAVHYHDLPAESTLRAYSEKSEVGTNVRESLNIQSNNSRAKIFPASYTSMWEKTKDKAEKSGLQGDAIAVEQIKKILNDYTKENSWISRVVHLHWNRNHVKEVHEIVKKIDKGELITSAAVINELEKIEKAKNPNPEGSFKKRLTFVKDKTEEQSADQQNLGRP